MATIMSSEPLDLDKRDNVNRLGCDVEGMIGNRYLHQGNGKTYQVTEIVWLGETDLWGVVHAEVLGPNLLNTVKVVRSWDNFFSYRADGKRRYVQVTDNG